MISTLSNGNGMVYSYIHGTRSSYSTSCKMCRSCSMASEETRSVRITIWKDGETCSSTNLVWTGSLKMWRYTWKMPVFQVYEISQYFRGWRLQNRGNRNIPLDGLCRYGETFQYTRETPILISKQFWHLLISSTFTNALINWDETVICT